MFIKSKSTSMGVLEHDSSMHELADHCYAMSPLKCLDVDGLLTRGAWRLPLDWLLDWFVD
jgi:hypothetical protein